MNSNGKKTHGVHDLCRVEQTHGRHPIQHVDEGARESPHVRLLADFLGHVQLLGSPGGKEKVESVFPDRKSEYFLK